MLLTLRLLGLCAPVTAVGAAVARWALAQPPFGAVGSGAVFPALLTELAAWTVVAGCLWTVGLLAAAAAETSTHHRVRVVRLVPAPHWARRWALGLLGAAVVSAGAAPAYAAQEDPGQRDARPHRAAIAGLPVPTRPDGAAPATAPRTGPAPATPPDRPPHRTVVVRPGDSLWGLVAARLPDRTDAHAVAAAVGATYRANRLAIGPDPDLITPGQRLVVRLHADDHPNQEER